MREFLFRKVVIKSITFLFSVLIWGQPALGCDDWRRDRICDLIPEIEKMCNDLDNDLLPILFTDEFTPLSASSLHLDLHRAHHEPAGPDRSQSLYDGALFGNGGIPALFRFKIHILPAFL